jgi:Mlc titration factor MtfA (ptsG expression regulator)
VRRQRLPYAAWQRVTSPLAACAPLSVRDRQRLRQLAGAFLAEKRLSGAHGLVVDADMRLTIAALACLPILHLGLHWYRHFREVIIYADTFVVDREDIDEAGVVHPARVEMAGEAWEQGPVILSWGDIVRDAERYGLDEGIALHEFTHKLDMLGGAANGRPPLHSAMDAAAWSEAFGSAYADLCERVDRGADAPIDPYASESPAEFFSVSCELFFLDPYTLRHVYPDVYAQLAAFFRRDPLPTPA